MFEAEDFGLDEGLSGNDDIEELDGLLEELGLTGASLIILLSTLSCSFEPEPEVYESTFFEKSMQWNSSKFFTFLLDRYQGALPQLEVEARFFSLGPQSFRGHCEDLAGP